MKSLGYLLTKPASYEDDADMFCLDLYKDIDLDHFIVMAEPAKAMEDGFAEGTAKPE